MNEWEGVDSTGLTIPRWVGGSLDNLYRFNWWDTVVVNEVYEEGTQVFVNLEDQLGRDCPRLERGL